MKFLAALALSASTLLFLGCQTSPSSILKQNNIETSGSIEISEFSRESLSDVNTSVIGVLIDQDGEPLVGGTIQIQGTMKGTACDLDGRFRLRLNAICFRYANEIEYVVDSFLEFGLNWR